MEQSRNFLNAALFFHTCLGHSLPMLTRSGNSGGEARLRYGDNDYDILSPGSYVTCAVTGRQIPIGALRYWSVDLQEAYWDAEAAAQRLSPPRS
jgi:hypothetical protein